MSALPPKPKYRQPCNHCGVCCQEELCLVAKLVFPDDTKAPCPGIMVREGKALCGVVLMEQASGAPPLAQEILAIGMGCTMADEETTLAEIDAFTVICQENAERRK